MIGSFIKLFAMAAAVGVSFATLAIAVAVVGLWMLGLAQDGEQLASPAEMLDRLARLP